MYMTVVVCMVKHLCVQWPDVIIVKSIILRVLYCYEVCAVNEVCM